MIRSGDKSS